METTKNSPSPRRVRPWGQSLRLLRRLLRLLRLPQSWGGSDRTKFYHPPLPLRRGPPTPDHTTLATRPMVVMALLEPQKCCILQWFLSLFGHRGPKDSQQGGPQHQKQNVPQGRFASGARKSKKTSQLGYQGATEDQPWLPHKGEGAPSLIVSSFFAPFVGLAS